jgi:hypothetical protein
MLTTTKWTLAALSAVALVGAAAAATPQGQSTTASFKEDLRAHLAAFHKRPVAAIDKVCDDNVTWGDCKLLLKEKAAELRGRIQDKADERYQECLEKRSQDYCDGRLDQFKADHPKVYGNPDADSGAGSGPAGS